MIITRHSTGSISKLKGRSENRVHSNLFLSCTQQRQNADGIRCFSFGFILLFENRQHSFAQLIHLDLCTFHLYLWLKICLQPEVTSGGSKPGWFAVLITFVDSKPASDSVVQDPEVFVWMFLMLPNIISPEYKGTVSFWFFFLLLLFERAPLRFLLSGTIAILHWGVSCWHTLRLAHRSRKPRSILIFEQSFKGSSPSHFGLAS